MIRPSFANEVTDGRTATRTTLTDGRTDGQTDGRTDGRTDGQTRDRSSIFFLKVKGLSFSITKEGGCGGVGTGDGLGKIVEDKPLHYNNTTIEQLSIIGL
ncbi:hypothetical protein DPMN_003287 [Dreissena polymorpha]|uniref:Uncharacterized protein n=1 Tax=Dreissena polymorpha TaxID=45954 RepID=A0A9D4MNK6_DREPO|nr:hypothetical protein DPMN_003287 [Dreissena polymorpha]